MTILRAQIILVLAFLAALVSGCSTSDPKSSAAEAGGEISWAYPAAELPGLDQQQAGEGVRAAIVLRPKGQSRSDMAVVYLHRWTALPPSAERDAINALAAVGAPLIYPVYQDAASTVEEYLQNALAGVRAALEQIEPVPESLVFVGQSTGGALAFDLAALAAESGFPRPLGAVALSPGRSPAGTMPRPDYAGIPPATKLLTIYNPDGRIPGTGREARRMLRLATRVPRSHKQIIRRAHDPWPRITSFVSGLRAEAEKGNDLT